MEFLGARFTSWITLQQQPADAFMIRTTKLEPEKAKAGDAAGAAAGSPPVLLHLSIRRAGEPFVSTKMKFAFLNVTAQGSLPSEAHTVP